MTRTYLIIGLIAAAVIAVLALGWMRIVDLPFFPKSPEAKLIDQMEQIAEGGIAVTFGERDIKAWKIANGHRLERFSVSGDDAVFARLTSTTPLDPTTFEWPSQGLSASLPTEFNNRSNGKPIEIGVVARATGSRPNATLSLVYATRQKGNSGWLQVPLGDQFQLKTFKYNVPKINSAYTNPPVVVLNSDPTGTGGSIEILGLYVKIAAPPESAQPPQ